MTDAVRPATSAARLSRSVWIWPLAGALLAAWPVWRSLADVPDIGPPPLRAQMAAAVGLLILVGAWVARHRQRIAGFHLPLFAMGFAVVVSIMAGAHADAATADLAALSICWLALAFLLAGAILLAGQDAFAAIQGGKVPPVSMLLRAHERIGYWLFGLALAAATIQETPQGFLLAALAAVSPGAILVWAGLCETTRIVLACRRTHVADATVLPALAHHKTLVFGHRNMLIAGRPKVASILPVGEAKPGEIVGIAAALLTDDDTDVARGLQEFGVSHRLRVPTLKSLDAHDGELGRGRLADGRVVGIEAVAADAAGDEELAFFTDQLVRAAELGRVVLALRAVEPARSLLGLIVMAKGARPGAAEMLRTLRKAGFTLVLADGAIDVSEREARDGLDIAQAGDWPAAAIGIVRPGQASLEAVAQNIQFGGWLGAASDDREIMIVRDDPRAIVDLLQFARDFRIRTRLAIIVANLPGVALLAAALGYVPASPLLVTGAALVGLVLAIGMPQALRLSPMLANEVDEE